MQQLDCHQNSNGASNGAQFTLVGGNASNFSRKPSYLLERRKSLPVGVLKSRCADTGKRAAKADSLSRESSQSLGETNGFMDAIVMGWEEDDVEHWLKEADMRDYVAMFKEHEINSGSALLSLTEEHLKEMGITKVGHRLKLINVLDALRRDLGLVSREKYSNLTTLLSQLHQLQLEKTVNAYPRRIILIRHGESEGNINNELYSTKPDRKMELTAKGRQQAYATGVELKKLLAEESVCFYVSPFVRSKQTFDRIRKAFHDEQVLHVREDPRIREQEWGNFQDPLQMKAVMDERRKVGSFYYRFPTGESGADVYDRVSTFLETMYRDMEKGGCGENAIIVSHGLFCRLFLMRYYHWPVEKFHKLWNFENCQYAIMEMQSGGVYRLISELKSDV